MASAAAKRYARAAFELAQEDGSSAAWHDRIALLAELVAVPELATALANRALPAAARAGLLESVAPKGLDREGLNLARLLVEHGRVAEAGAVLEEYDRLVDEAEGRLRATVTAAVDIADEDRRRLERDLATRFGRDVRLEVAVDPQILGGLVLRVGDRLVDASIRTRLQQLRRRLATATT